MILGSLRTIGICRSIHTKGSKQFRRIKSKNKLRHDAQSTECFDWFAALILGILLSITIIIILNCNECSTYMMSFISHCFDLSNIRLATDQMISKVLECVDDVCSILTSLVCNGWPVLIATPLTMWFHNRFHFNLNDMLFNASNMFFFLLHSHLWTLLTVICFVAELFWPIIVALVMCLSLFVFLTVCQEKSESLTAIWPSLCSSVCSSAPLHWPFATHGH